MSFGGASRDHGKDRSFTSIHVIGGNDCVLENLRSAVDLRIKGGAIIEKSACILGNLNVQEMLMGQTCGNILTQKIQEKELSEGIEIIGNIMLDIPNSVRVGGAILGNSSLQFNSVQIIGLQEPAIPNLTDSTGGTSSGTLGPFATITGGGNASVLSVQSAINDIGNAIVSLDTQIVNILEALRSHGLIG